ncbi:MAG TPA: Ku protein [Jatrophihabitantaceae bacterium]|jgi:DNA end-binding protein Ku
MRAIWKGAVSFGLVNIGVKMFAATEEHDISFHQVRRSDGSRIRYRRVAEADGEEVAYADIAKGYTLPGGDTVVLSDEDFADLPLPSARVVDVLQFVPADQIDPIYFAKSYFLEPEQPAVKPYVLLRDALDSSGMVGLVKVALRNREQLATLRVREGVIVLETMIWPDEVREASFAFLDDDVQVRPQEQAMAESLVASMAGDFEPEQYHDDYREALQKVIDAKIEGREIVETAPAAPDTGQVVDLMAALRASVEAAKRSRGEAAPAKKARAAEGGAPTVSPGASASRAKKAPAKKVTAKKAPARKAPAKKVSEKAARRKSA